MEAIHDPGQSSVSWARLVEVLRPLSLRADKLAGMELFAGLRWSDLEFVAERLREAEVERGTRPRCRRGAGVADRRIRSLKQSRARRPSWQGA
jgi:hypothetical protein